MKERCSKILHHCILASGSWISHQKELESTLHQMQKDYTQARSRMHVEKEKITEMVKSFEAQLSSAAVTEKCM